MSAEAEIKELIDRLNLLPHPEGGYYRETYRSDAVVSPNSLPGFSGDRNISTAIYFLLTAGNFSAFHRIKSDEVWHFYHGSSAQVHVIDERGVYKCHLLGTDFKNNETPQLVVKAGDWFGSSVSDGGSYSLVGCTVAPGFDFNDFEMANCKELLESYPEHREIILKLTRV
jgi:predicted cupin superfamily sugar epimerase